MIGIDYDKCTGCALCQKSCPLEAIRMEDKKPVPEEGKCANCGTCVRVCKKQAIRLAEDEGAVKCTSCSVQCRIPPGGTGACKRYVNIDGKLVRNRAPVAHQPPATLERELPVLFTGVGAGTTYPDYNPGAYIIEQEVEGIDIITVVSEAPLSYSSMLIKIDTNYDIGEEGSIVTRDKSPVGMVITEQYGSKMISIGGVNRIKGKHGIAVARTIAEIANGERVTLQVKGGSTLELRVGSHPVIDGKVDELMRVGCGGAVVALFAKHLKEVVDEVIILDSHITGTFTGHPAGAELIDYKSGITPRGTLSGPGRYFGKSGPGWGGTDVLDPKDAIVDIDMNYAWEGMRVLVTETTGRQAAFFRVTGEGGLERVEIPPEVQAVVDLINENCESARVSAVFMGGCGGSARAGVTSNPIELTKAVHAGEAKLTVAGVPAYVLPGGGINFLVDVEGPVEKPFTWIPTPAMVVPIEYTMRREVFERIKGHVGSIRPLKEVLEKEKVQIVERKKK